MGRKTYTILVGNSEGTRSCGQSRHRWEDNIKMYLKEIWKEGAEIKEGM
jgi:hypothetical protein